MLVKKMKLFCKRIEDVGDGLMHEEFGSQSRNSY